MQRTMLPIALAVISSLVQLAGVMALGWPAGNIILLLWVENVILTGFALVRLSMVPRTAFEDSRATMMATPLIFTLVHFGFTMALAFSLGLEFTMMALGIPMVLVLIRYLVEAVGQFAGGYRPSTPKEATGAAMGRIGMLHIAIIAAWFIFVPFGFMRGFGGSMAPRSSFFPEPVHEFMSEHYAIVILLIVLTAKTIYEVRSIWKATVTPVAQD